MDAPSPRRSVRARGAILIVVVAAMLFSSVYPLGRYFSIKREIAALETQEASLDAELEVLQDDRATLLTDAEVERLARERLGFIEPGESAFAIVDPSKEEAPDPIVPTDEPASDDRDGMLERWWNALTHAARAM